AGSPASRPISYFASCDSSSRIRVVAFDEMNRSPVTSARSGGASAPPSLVWLCVHAGPAAARAAASASMAGHPPLARRILFAIMNPPLGLGSLFGLFDQLIQQVHRFERRHGGEVDLAQAPAQRVVAGKNSVICAGAAAAASRPAKSWRPARPLSRRARISLARSMISAGMPASRAT